ncbi:hypothetical protein [Castellaniella sp. MT123]|uniref:hypothetical protein n=1 Tax=Castellaniella sp. MT123 TaxID=3140381 RepID=UPI0031F3F0F0
MSETEEEVSLSHYDLLEEFTAHEAACLIAGLDPVHWETERETYKGPVSTIKKAMARDWERTYHTVHQEAEQWEKAKSPTPDEPWRRDGEFLPSQDFWMDWDMFCLVGLVDVLGRTGPVDDPAFDEIVFHREDIAAWLRARRYRSAHYFWTEGDSEQKASEIPSQPEVERDRLLRLVGALALLLAERPGRYRRGDRPNALQIAEATAELMSAMPDANSRGLGNSNIRASVSEGVTLLLK